MAVTTALVLTFCICQAQCWGVEAAWLPGPSGQTDGPAPARARPALRLGQGYIGVWRLVKHLEVQRGAPVTQHNHKICVFLTNTDWNSNWVFEAPNILRLLLPSVQLDEKAIYIMRLFVNHQRFRKTFYTEVAISLYLSLH